MKLSVKYPYHSLEDYLSSRPLDVDGLLDDGWGAAFPIKGREIDATVVFVDIGGFSRRTYDLTPTETLIFVNNFFSWITAEGLHDKPGIVDKYVGDEMMIVFSTEFGSTDPFADALVTALRMADQDVLAFCPHIGLAAGPVVVGYVGTPLRYNCSVFGRTVNTASRCCAIRGGNHTKSIYLPVATWRDKKLSDVKNTRHWDVAAPRTVSIKNMPPLEVVEIYSDLMHTPSRSAEDRARMAFEGLKKDKSYNPRRYAFEPGYPAEKQWPELLDNSTDA
jgi:hypothetical protein